MMHKPALLKLTQQMQKNRHTIRVLCLLSFLALLLPRQALPQGNLLVMPRRIIFSGQKKSHELNIANIGKDTARYVISVINYRMTASGSFETIDEPDSGQQFAGNYLRFFPHSVVLAPNESQVVKVQLSKSGQLAPGEYRSHIYFRAVPNESTPGEPAPAGSTGISIRLVPVFGISIPLIIRVGELNSGVTLSGLSVHQNKDSLPELNITFNRTGTMSVYGNVAVDFVSAQGITTRVGAVTGLAVYTPNPLRTFNLLLDNTKGIDYHTGKLHVVFSEQLTARPLRFTEADVVLN